MQRSVEAYIHFTVLTIILSLLKKTLSKLTYTHCSPKIQAPDEKMKELKYIELTKIHIICCTPTNILQPAIVPSSPFMLMVKVLGVENARGWSLKVGAHIDWSRSQHFIFRGLRRWWYYHWWVGDCHGHTISVMILALFLCWHDAAVVRLVECNVRMYLSAYPMAVAMHPHLHALWHPFEELSGVRMGSCWLWMKQWPERVSSVNANSVWPGFTGTDFSSGYSRCSWGDLWI